MREERKVSWRMRTSRIRRVEVRNLVRGMALLVACAFLATGCATAVALRTPMAGPQSTCVTPAPERDLLVGVALSGGGSRAALFGASGLEALAQVRAPGGASVLDQVTYLSSVSGGSVAASYYAMKKPSKETAFLGPDGALTEDYKTFFAGYKNIVSQDFESALLWRQIGSFRWILNPALAAQSLTELFTEQLLGPVTFGDLSAREARGDSPRLIINTTLYNNGRRLAMTTLPPDTFRYDFFGDLRQSMVKRGKSAEYPPVLVRRWESVLPLTPLDLKMDLCPVKVAGAVTGSASFPPVVGPITFGVGEEELYWHTGDGGLYENSGTESLLIAFLKQVQAKKSRRALIIAFESSYPFWVGYRKLTKRAEPWTLGSYEFSRISGIMEERATAYMSLFYRSMQIEGVFPDNQTMRVIFLRHTDAKWKDDLSDRPEVCRQESPPLDSPTAVVERIAEIPTRFKLASECDRQLLITAAAKVVAQNKQEIEGFLAGRPTQEGTT
ncbi:MAG: patatin-like phospholipase family protein, partial [Deltaproteobacteria bacterium]|nr:patatin-like phospholipase family protein [Deltaproteobacteria bacterium]